MDEDTANVFHAMRCQNEYQEKLWKRGYYAYFNWRRSWRSWRVAYKDNRGNKPWYSRAVHLSVKKLVVDGGEFCGCNKWSYWKWRWWSATRQKSLRSLTWLHFRCMGYCRCWMRGIKRSGAQFGAATSFWRVCGWFSASSCLGHGRNLSVLLPKMMS